jgi:hypothetical protein
LSLLAALALAAAAPADCSPEGAFDYVCGPEKPEDLLVLPGTPWLVASGFAPGAGLKLVDTRSRAWRKWYAGGAQVRWDRQTFPHCPGPLDPALFNARGLGGVYIQDSQSVENLIQAAGWMEVSMDGSTGTE